MVPEITHQTPALPLFSLATVLIRFGKIPRSQRQHACRILFSRKQGTGPWLTTLCGRERFSNNDTDVEGSGESIELITILWSLSTVASHVAFQRFTQEQVLLCS